MRVWELEAGIAVMLFALAAPVLLIPAVRRLYRTYGRAAGWPTALLGLGGLYGFALVAFTQFPLPSGSADACQRTTGGWRLRPFASFVESADTAAEVGIAAYLTSGSFLQEAMNILLLVPLGVILGVRTKRPWWTAALAGLAVSLVIEFSQGTGLWGTYDCPYRLAEFDDLVTNTAGAVAGWGIGRWAKRWFQWPDRASVSDLGAPSPSRRLLGAVCDLVAIVVAGIVFQVLAAVVVRVLTGGDTTVSSWPFTWTWLLGSLAPAAVVAVVAPLARSDRATVGQWAVLLSPVRRNGDPPSTRDLSVRAAIRWIPFCLAGLTIFGPLVFLVGALIQVVFVLVRSDHASLAEIGSGVRTVNRDSQAEP